MRNFQGVIYQYNSGTDLSQNVLIWLVLGQLNPLEVWIL